MEQAGSQMKLLLDVYEQDRKHVMILVTLCFAIPAFTLQHLLVRDGTFWVRGFLLTSLVLFVAAGLFFFRYAQRQNWKRLEGVEFILKGRVEELYDVLMGPTKGLWARHGWLYRVGGSLLKIASTFYVFFLGLYLFSKT